MDRRYYPIDEGDSGYHGQRFSQGQWVEGGELDPIIQPVEDFFLNFPFNNPIRYRNYKV